MGKKLKKRGKRKSEQKLTPKMEVIQSTSSSAHSPMDSAEEDGKTWFDSSPSLDTHFTVATELDTPVKPANKRSKREKTEMSANSNTESSMDILAAIRELSVKHDATFQKIF